MDLLWQSQDGYVRVVDNVQFPDEDTPDQASDLDMIFRAGAWLVLWRKPGGRWCFTRNRRYAKPGLQALRRVMQQERLDGAHDIWIAATDAHGHVLSESEINPGTIAKSFYEAWGHLAANALPAKIAHLGLDRDEPNVEQVPAWMRPGLPRYAERSAWLREIREVAAEAR